MKKILIAFLFLIFKLNLNAASFSVMSKDTLISMDSVREIRISIYDFDSLVRQYFKMIESDSEFSVDQTIEIVKLYNTISFSLDTAFQKKYEQFSELFLTDFLIIALKKLNATTWRLGSFYSSEYKIFIGGPEDRSSRFLLE